MLARSLSKAFEDRVYVDSNRHGRMQKQLLLILAWKSTTEQGTIQWIKSYFRTKIKELHTEHTAN